MPGVSRRNPLPFGSTVTQKNLSIVVDMVVRGEDAWRMLQDANPYNEPLPPSQEYLLVKVRVKNIGTGDDAEDISSSKFYVTGDNLHKYSRASAVVPEPELRGGIFPGGELAGWIVYAVGVGERNLLLVISAPYTSDAPTEYLALEEGAVIATDPMLGVQPVTSNGLSRAKPAEIGELLRTKNWEITVNAILRGEKAWQKIADANLYNDPPADGMTYMLANVSARYIGDDDDGVWLDSSEFKTTGSKNIIYYLPGIVEPEPRLDAILYPGGRAKGWIALQFAEGEENRQLIFDAQFDDARRFIKLSE